ncbi:WecB/TagA/CpsF family glycosyltransferase [bacterium]|nr:WecB/TagA/CpsF family glycosyltransferase [bacterium]
MNQIETRPVLGYPIAVTDYRSAVAWIAERGLAQDRAYAVEAANTHVLALARHDEEFGAAMRKFDLICPDGQPLVWSLNAQLPEGGKLTDRVYGPTLMEKTLHGEGQAKQLRHFFLGGKEDTLTNLREHFSDRNISGTYSPPFGEWPASEFEKIANLIRDSGAHCVWVGLGCPKQELWIAKHLDQLPPAVYFGIGAAFAFHAGEVRQAPALIQKFGLEWLFRLCMEPRRLFKRYLVYNSLFLFHTLRDHIRG